MKGIDIFCASQASTAIRSTMDEGSSSSSTIHLGRSRAIDRYNPIIRDATRITKQPLPRTSNSQPPIAPKLPPHKSRNTSSSFPKDLQTKKSSNSVPNGGREGKSNSRSTKWSCAKPGDFISPAGSSRYLLNDKAFFDVLSDFDPLLTLFPVEVTSKSQAVEKDESIVSRPPPSSPSTHQVVVLRVSLHCRGCERKMRKHISRMEGVTSFDIDFAAKKLTVIGDVTPLAVLASVSKVKNAQLLTPSISSSVTPFGSSHSEIKKSKGVVI